MRQLMNARLLLLFLAIPVIAYAASWGVQAKLDSDLRTALASAPEAQGRDVSGVTMDKFCAVTLGADGADADPEVQHDVAEVCGLVGTLHLMQTAAVASVGIGFGLLALVALGGRIARGRRTLLLIAFTPLLHLTMLTLSVLMVLHAGLGMATLYYAESAFIGRVHIGLMLGLGLGALLGVLALLQAQFGAVRKATSIVIGKQLDRAHHPRLWEFVDKLARAMGVSGPDAIVVGLEPNFYVTEANIICPDGKLTGRTMYLSAPLCRLFSLDELKSVLAHELAHYKGRDTQFSRRFYPIYRGATEGLVRIAQSFSGRDNGSASNLVLMPAYCMLSYFLGSFSEAEKKIGRDRELAADAEAATIGSARTIATALVKVHAFSGGWSYVREQMRTALANGKVLINPSVLFAGLVADVVKEHDALATLGEEGPVHPTDTHPPLSHRLKALGIALDDVRLAALQVTPDNAGIAIIDDAESLEEGLSDIEHTLMVQRGEAQVGSAPETLTQAS
jgi:Zn-dependent protease with chaperone function